ncbi:MAG: toll/interleukin-1 receptor domain-containing protein [Planctomycetota bacterium]
MSDVFLSYARDDRAFAERLVAIIKREGWTVWWDRELLGGAAYDLVIEEELGLARCVVVVWSARSVRSDWVKAEAAEGSSRSVLVPVTMDDTRPPLEFRRRQTISFAAQRPGDEPAKELVAAVRAALARSAALDTLARVRVTCAECGGLSVAPARLAGQFAKCRRCGAKVKIPAEAAAAAGSQPATREAAHASEARSGRRPSHRIVLAVLLGVLVIAAIAAIWWVSGLGGSRPPDDSELPPAEPFSALQPVTGDDDAEPGALNASPEADVSGALAPRETVPREPTAALSALFESEVAVVRSGLMNFELDAAEQALDRAREIAPAQPELASLAKALVIARDQERQGRHVLAEMSGAPTAQAKRAAIAAALRLVEATPALDRRLGLSSAATLAEGEANAAEFAAQQAFDGLESRAGRVSDLPTALQIAAEAEARASALTEGEQRTRLSTLATTLETRYALLASSLSDVRAIRVALETTAAAASRAAEGTDLHELLLSWCERLGGALHSAVQGLGDDDTLAAARVLADLKAVRPHDAASDALQQAVAALVDNLRRPALDTVQAVSRKDWLAGQRAKLPAAGAVAEALAALEAELEGVIEAARAEDLRRIAEAQSLINLKKLTQARSLFETLRNQSDPGTDLRGLALAGLAECAYRSYLEVVTETGGVRDALPDLREAIKHAEVAIAEGSAACDARGVHSTASALYCFILLNVDLAQYYEGRAEVSRSRNDWVESNAAWIRCDEKYQRLREEFPDARDADGKAFVDKARALIPARSR